MPLREVFPCTPKKVRHLSRTQHLKPFFGKSMRLAGKEKKAEKKQMIRLRSEPGGYRRKKKLGEEETRGGGKAEGERAGGACA